MRVEGEGSILTFGRFSLLLLLLKFHQQVRTFRALENMQIVENV